MAPLTVLFNNSHYCNTLLTCTYERSSRQTFIAWQHEHSYWLAKAREHYCKDGAIAKVIGTWINYVMIHLTSSPITYYRIIKKFLKGETLNIPCTYLKITVEIV